MQKLFFLLINLMAFAQHEYHQKYTDKPSTHGMLIFGTSKIYASHLPMFHSPHDYQIILELEFSKADKTFFISYQKSNPNEVTYTIEPERFVLPEMIDHPKPFKVNLYAGHFERGGKLLKKDIFVKIKEVIHNRKFNLQEPKVEKGDYIVFGNSAEQFAVHYITNKPDFEQIIQIKLLNYNDKTDPILTLSNSNKPIGVSGNEVEDEYKKKVYLQKQIYLEFTDLE